MVVCSRETHRNSHHPCCFFYRKVMVEDELQYLPLPLRQIGEDLPHMCSQLGSIDALYRGRPDRRQLGGGDLQVSQTSKELPFRLTRSVANG